ncbi:HET-domain-containing protein [Polyplosphaeria fusca]|uniref:HET-domain-containing protein n=1 Tax=Polyplosphaeria fusca TaxID=682080 RepID=A0A9P4R3J6_9PLEO|nr:HET-domain-containing protein [Polyplosphaeria fusca]
MHRLCIYCRSLEPVTAPCPRLTGGSLTSPSAAAPDISSSPVSGLAGGDIELVRSLQQKPSSLCERCSGYDVVDVFTTSEPLDEIQRANIDYAEYNARMFRYRLSLGQPSSVLLDPACPLCRLLYSILPRDFQADEPSAHLEPHRSHIRQSMWELFPEALKSQCAIHLGLATGWSPFSPISDPFKAGGDNIRWAMMDGPAICYETQSAPHGRSMRNAKPVQCKLDLSMLIEPLEHCEREHRGTCHVRAPPELLKTRMIDITERKVVPCPPDCDYIALSYVWGGVQPSQGALENKCLPQTIEDAITVTRALCRRYLWVDALCIDQSSNPTPAELQAKIEQLNMMATIYGCATVTIVALTGEDSNAGLSGVSLPRPVHMNEIVNGHRLFTIPPNIGSEIDRSKWSSRAWTLQEELISRRRLHFAESQVEFSCMLGSVWEVTRMAMQALSVSWVTPYLISRADWTLQQAEVKNPDLVSFQGRMKLFDGMLQNYTSRDMTHDRDSLNALLGLLVSFQRQLFPDGFTQGLPLKTHPSSLGWIHDKSATPKRRHMFPSWSWAGWQGRVLFPGDVLGTFDDGVSDSISTDLGLRVTASSENEITVEGWLAVLDIRTAPFSEIFVPGREESIGTVMERNFLHNNTLPTGLYSCLVLHRRIEKNSTRVPPRQKVFMIVLEWTGQAAQRQTMITMTPFAGHDLMEVGLEKANIRLV